MVRRVYLDSNVLIEVFDGNLPRLAVLLGQSVAAGSHEFPFSADQVMEIATGKDADRDARRLRQLSELSQDLYFEMSLTSVGFRTLSPAQVYENLQDVIIDPKADRLVGPMLPRSDLHKFRQELGIDVVLLNQLAPSEALQYIETMLAESPLDPADALPLRSISDFLRYGEKLIEMHFPSTGDRPAADPDLAITALHRPILGLFALLDSFGYGSDRSAAYAKGSRLADIRHAFNASRCHRLVSRDGRFLKKANAAYEYFGIDVLVQHTADLEADLSEAAPELGSCRR